MRLHRTAVATLLPLLTAAAAIGEEPSTGVLRSRYPNWPADEASMGRLRSIEEFIRAHGGGGRAAVFDWDGTLYGERIRIRSPPPGMRHPDRPRAAQPAWHLWAAGQLAQRDHPGLLPAFRSAESQAERARNVARRDDFLEAAFENEPDDVSKFLQTATFEAGMRPAELDAWLERFLDDYDPCSLALLPMLDVLQRLTDAGFETWVVTGSNPYVVAATVRRIERRCPRDGRTRYHFQLTGARYDPVKDRIVGNGARLDANGAFSLAYDDRALRPGSDEAEDRLHVIANEGKAVAVRRWIERRRGREVVFVAGNSDGDDAMVRHVLDKAARGVPALAVGVNARGRLLPETLRSYADRSSARVIQLAVAQCGDMTPGEDSRCLP